MSNVCEVEKIELKEKAFKEDMRYLELMDIIDKQNQKIVRLENENKQLNLNIIELHNELEVKRNTEDASMLNEYEEEYLCGCESEEDLKAYAEALNDCSLPTVD